MTIKSFKFSEEMITALDELAHGDRFQSSEADSKTGWLEVSLAHFIKMGLVGKVHKGQLGRCQTPDETFRLFVEYSKAVRKEPGYSFMPGKFVYHKDD